MKYSIEELETLMEEFLLTIPNDERDEWYDTYRNLHKNGSWAFLEWLKEKEYVYSNH